MKGVDCKETLSHYTEPSDTNIDYELDPTSAPHPNPPVPLRRSTRISRPPDRLGFTHTYLLLSFVRIPNSYSQAM